MLASYSRSSSIPAIRRTCRTLSTSSQKPTYSHISTALLLGALGAGVAASFFFQSNKSRSAPTYHDRPLASNHFTPVVITSSEPSVPDTKLLTLSVPSRLLPPQSLTSPIWSVFIKDDDIQVERPYTPLYGIDSQGCMSFWIKKYPNGEVGRWLHSKKVGDTIELRGPLKTWPWEDGKWDEVVMISGGTGITPFCQLFHHTIISQQSPNTRFTLLHASKTLADIPPPAVIRPLVDYATQNPDRFKLHLFVDSLDGSKHSANSQLQVGRIGKAAIQQSLGLAKPGGSFWGKLFGSSSPPVPSRPDKKILFLVCGPDPMIAAISGPLGRNFSQGVVGGVLGEMGSIGFQCCNEDFAIYLRQRLQNALPVRVSESSRFDDLTLIEEDRSGM